LLSISKFVLCVLFLAALAFACYRSQIDNLDRYIYEGIVLGKTHSVEVAYSIVKHESPAAERSSVMDSPQHLREGEPMYTIRPLYLETISVLSKVLPIQKAISLISASALFGTGIIVLCWTERPLLTALLMAAYPIPYLGRLGGPDAMAALLVIASLWLLSERKNLALILLFVSLGVRTDDILILLAVLAWLIWEKKIPQVVAALIAIIGIGTVLAINHWAGNYGWIVLFRFSFIGGLYPAQIPHVLTIREYLHAFARGVYADLDRVAVWLLLGILAWRRGQDTLLIVAGSAVAVHFLLFPSPEDRYLIWAYIVAGVSLIRSFDQETNNGRANLAAPDA
jgi:hypothetical protein